MNYSFAAKLSNKIESDVVKTQSERARNVELATAELSKIVAQKNLCARFQTPSVSLLVGHKALRTNATVDFVFDSDSVFDLLMKRMRLFDFAVAYFDGKIRISGSIFDAVDILDAMNVATDRPQSSSEKFQLTLFRLLKALVPAIAKRFESLDHYSQSAGAYELFLDDHMQYTSGRFEFGNEDINQAQIAKFHLIANLATKHSNHLAGKDHLDIGCGWGGMGAYFKSHFGTNSVGNTNCERQMEYAKRHYSSEIIFGDFSDLKYCKRRFDLITIIGMIEHLTPYRRSQLLGIVSHLLKDGGVVYLQCITKPDIWIGGDAYRLTQKEVFPGHFLETHEQTELRIRNHGFTILENLEHGLDYGLTASRWVDNIQRNEKKLISIIGARQYRMYLGYLAFGSKLFSSGRGSLRRYVFTKI